VVAAALRVPFHMYYGWTTLAFALWAVGAVILYRRMANIVPFILAHATQNTVVSVGDMGGAWSLVAISYLPLFIAIALISLGYMERHMNDKPAIWRHGNHRRRFQDAVAG